MNDSIKGRVAIVTGAGKGIGQAIAKRFARAGAKVIVNDVDSQMAEATTQAIVAAGHEAMCIPADVSDSDAVKAMFEKTTDTFGTVDILVNNAGLISPMLHFLDADEAWWQRIIGVNLTGTFLCSQRAAHIMARKGKGVIINMSSGGATRAHRAFTAYDASKGGIEALTRAMALDLGPYGVRVNALMPGSIDTENMDEAARRLRGENIPLSRIGDPDDMAGPAVFLASDDASYITGHVLKVDGGMLSQQRSATVDIYPPSKFPKIGSLGE